MATTYGIDQYSATGTLGSYLRWTFNVGSRFSIIKIRLPFGGAVTNGAIISPKIYFDGLSSNKTPTVINYANFPNSRHVTYKTPELKDYIGENDFTLELAWTGTVPLPVALPITIDLELWADEPDK